MHLEFDVRSTDKIISADFSITTNSDHIKLIGLRKRNATHSDFNGFSYPFNLKFVEDAAYINKQNFNSTLTTCLN